MSIPDAVLSAFIEAKGAREATRAIAGVQKQLQECTKEANIATAAVNRFGRTRGIAVLDVDSAKARAQVATATKEVAQFSKTNGTAVLEANGSSATRSVVKASAEVRAFGALTAEARADLKITGALAQIQVLKARLADLRGQDQTLEVRVQVAKAVADLDRAEAKSRDLRDSLDDLGDGGRIGGGGLAALRSGLAGLPDGFGRLGSAALAAGVGLLAIVGPAVAVVAALGPLVGLAAGAAGGLVALVGAFGVFKLATMGVGDALKEQMKASAGAGTAALQQAGQEVAASRAIRGAQEAVADAQRRVREAVDALGPAYQEARARIADMRAAVTGTSLSLREARFAASDARKALSELLAGPSPRVLADAHRAVADALRGERSAAEGLADAHRVLNDLLAPPAILDLADARDAAADATRGEARAALELAAQVKATNAILSDPGASEADKASARLALADAENAVGDAARQTARSQAALAKLEGGPAQDEVARARGRVKDAEAAVAAAKRDTLDAQAALAKAESPASSDEIARARLALAQAQHGLAGATRDAAKAARDYGVAEAAGIARAPEVLAAREAVRAASVAATRAERSLTEAQADAASSAGLAAASATNLSEKFDKLPPAAQAFVRQLQAMKPRLDELRATAAGGFFPGASAGLVAASGSFREINAVVKETSGVLGEAARKSGELVGSPAFGKDIQTIGGNNAKVIGTLAEALRHVISALRHVLVAAGPLTQWLADVANKWALNAAEAAKAGRETGKLAAFFEKTKAVAQRLGSIIGNLAKAFFGIGKAGTDSGNSILLSIDRMTERFAVWANSVKGQTAIREFFEKTRELAAELVRVVAGIAKGFTDLSLKLLPLVTILKTLAPIADEAVVAFVAFKLAMTGARIAVTLWAAQAAIATFATGGWTTAFWALNAAMVANPIGLVVVAIAALVAGLIIAYKESETFRAIVDAAFKGVTQAFGWILTAAQAVFGWLKANWPLVAMILTGPIRTAVTVIGGLWDTMRSAAVTAWTAIRSVAGTAWGLIRDAILTPIRFAREQMDVVVTGIGTRLATGWEAIKSAAAAAWDIVRDNVLGPIREARTLLETVMDGIVNRVQGGWDAVIKGVKSFGTSVKDTIMGAFEGARDGVVGFINQIIRAINFIPGIPNIQEIKIDKDARGGTFARTGGMPGATEAFAHGGAFARTGGFVNSPMTLMGEEAPRHPEFVIPTNPAYRGRAQMLLGQAAGAIGLAEGGVVSAFKGAIKETGASQKPSLALFEAGIVESGLRNLTYGDADSLGALQLRESLHGRALAMNPFAAAMAFLTRGFTGRGGAISLSKSDLSAGQVAQAVQGSAFPDRYDQVRDQALEYVGGKKGGGGIGAAITGAIGALLSNGPGEILGKLPGVGDLPDWLKGTGKYVLDAAGDWIKNKVSGLFGGDGDGGPGVMTGTNAKAAKLAQMFNATITSGYRDPAHNAAVGGVAGSSHTKGSPSNPGAHDFVPAQSALLAEALKMGAKWVDNHDFGSGLHSHVSWFKQGGMYGGAPFVGSYATGGTIPRDGMAYVHKGENVTPAGQNNDALIASNDRLAAELRDLRMRGVAVVTLTDQVGQQLGNDAVRRGQTAGDPSRTAIVR